MSVAKEIAARVIAYEWLGSHCHYCGTSDGPMEVEHILPRSRGGTDDVENLTVACSVCNHAKFTKTGDEFMNGGIPSGEKEPLRSMVALARFVVREKVLFSVIDQFVSEVKQGKR